MTKIPISCYLPPQPGAFTPEQRKMLSATYPLIGSEKVLRGVERILHELFVDIERYSLMPTFASTLAVIKATKKALDRTAKNLRALTNSGADNTHTFISLELEATLATMKAGKHITLAHVDDTLGTLDVALDLVIERLSAQYGGRNGAPSDIALDMWVERMNCLWQSVGGSTKTTWAEDDVAVGGGRRENKLVDLLVDLAKISDTGFKPGDKMLDTVISKQLTVSALGQRWYRVDAAWKRASPSMRRRRRLEVQKFCTPVLGQSPRESGSVPARGKEARADDKGDKLRRVHRAASSRPVKSARTKRR